MNLNNKRIIDPVNDISIPFKIFLFFELFSFLLNWIMKYPVDSVDRVRVTKNQKVGALDAKILACKLNITYPHEINCQAKAIKVQKKKNKAILFKSSELKYIRLEDYSG